MIDFAETQKGPGKAENEDRVVFGGAVLAGGAAAVQMQAGVLAVADGVGGRNAGAAASDFVAQRICALRQVDLLQMEKINADLLARAAANQAESGMATTLAGICLADGKAQLFSVGNSRVYLLQGGKYLKQLTTDDTTVNLLLALGQLSEADIGQFDRKNEITACFGGGDARLFRFKLSEIAPPTSPVMITSDGIHDYLSVDDMEEIISESGVSAETCARLIAAARDRGSTDDAGVLLAAPGPDGENRP